MKKTLTLLSLITAVIAMSSFNVYESPSTCKKKKPTYEIGQKTQGGIIFFLNKDKTHGLAAALQDQMANDNYEDCLDAINNPEHHDAAGKEFTDWRMPKLWEAYKMYMNLHVDNMGDFSASGYWTSKASIGFDKMHVLNFAKGIDFTSLKSDTYRARAVRSF